MRAILEQFIQVNNMFWEGSLFQWAFCFGVVLILILEKNTTKKIVFGVFPLVILGIIFNPITFVAGNIFFDGVHTYYVRLFSIVPVFYCIAHGMIMILNKTKGVIKLVGVCILAGVIIIIGHSVFREPWLQKAENPEKVPTDVLAVIESIPWDDEDVCIAFPTPLNVYARQINAKIKMPYGRSWSLPIALLDELNKPVPEVSTVMSLAGNQAVDYVVAKNSEEAREAFAKENYYPIGETPRYLVYAVTGVDYIKRTFNEKNQITSVTTFDSNGNIIENSAGYATICYEYDKWGNCSKETYLDKAGSVYTPYFGYASIQRQYGFSGLVKSMVYLDANDNPVLCSGKCETKYIYDSNRRIIHESYYDENGNPLLVSGRYATGFKYNQSGQIIQESYYDEYGHITKLSNSVFASRRIEYDNEGNFVSESYFDEEGEPVLLDVVNKNNLIWNGDFKAGTIRWSQWNWPTMSEVEEISGKNWMHFVSSGLLWEGIQQNVSSRSDNTKKAELFAGEAYTLSFEAVAAEGSDGKTLAFGIHNCNLDNGSITDNFWESDNTLSKEPQKYTYTFIPSVDGTFRFMFGSDEAIDAYFTDFRLEKSDSIADTDANS